jgi:hypothetical protein
MLSHHTTPATVHSSKDFVEHLRTVHFTLVAIAVGLILILSRAGSPALTQIREIIELKKEWPPEQIALVGNHALGVLYARTTSGDRAQDNNIEVHWKGHQQIKASTSWEKKRKQDAVILTLPEEDWSLDYRPGHYSALSPFPQTLDNFRLWWNMLGTDDYRLRLIIPLATYDGFVYAHDDYAEVPIAKIHLLRLSEPSLVSASGQPKLVKLEIHQIRTGTRTDYFYFGKDGESQYVLPLKVQVVDVDRELICRIEGWSPGRFDTKFGALAKEANELESEDLEQVEKVLAERLATDSEVFEAFGMKFPNSQVTVWGTLILLAIQLYFFLYLRQLSGKLRPDDPGWDIPWICMNQSFLAQSICFATVIVLPFLAMLLTGSQASLRLTADYWVPDSWDMEVQVKDWDSLVLLQIGAYFLASIAALVLGIASWMFRPRLILNTERHCSAQLFE